MARIVCLANSKREGGRCVAGIDLDTGVWVRPIVAAGKPIPYHRLVITGKELAILDVVQIPLKAGVLYEKYQRENRLILPGSWRIIDQLEPRQVLKYCEDDCVILHNHEKKVKPSELEGLSPRDWKSLQLIRSRAVRYHKDNASYNQRQWRAHIMDGSGNPLHLPVTDLVVSNRLDRGAGIGEDCILTISLGTAYEPPGGYLSPACYKLVAGVIELASPTGTHTKSST